MNISIPITLELWKCVKFFETFDLFIRVEKVSHMHLYNIYRFEASEKWKVSYDNNVILSSLSFFNFLHKKIGRYDEILRKNRITN